MRILGALSLALTPDKHIRYLDICFNEIKSSFSQNSFFNNEFFKEMMRLECVMN